MPGLNSPGDYNQRVYTRLPCIYVLIFLTSLNIQKISTHVAQTNLQSRISSCPPTNHPVIMKCICNLKKTSYDNIVHLNSMKDYKSSLSTHTAL
jgi:hypothetical protein